MATFPLTWNPNEWAWDELPDEAGAVQAGEVVDRLSELIIRAYQQADNPAISTRCLDTIDELLRVGAMGLQRVLGKFDR